jgi:hypothetical protein
MEHHLDLVGNARLFALLNTATADALIACWDAKYTDNFWRPVTAIQFAGDSSINPATESDPTWTPLIVTPNFPSYTSAHSTVSGAAATILTALFGPDHAFSTGSDGLPGVTRSFRSFYAAAAEAGQSRIYGGIHFQFDNRGGLASGHDLGGFVFDNFLVPLGQEEAGGEGQHDRSTDARTHLVGTVFDGASFVSALAASEAAPEIAGPTLMPDGHRDTLGVTPVGTDQSMQAASGPDRLIAESAHRRVLDQVFADWDDSTLTERLQGTEIPAWAV